MQFAPQPAFVPMQQPMVPNFAYPSPYGLEQVNYNLIPAVSGATPLPMNAIPGPLPGPVNYGPPPTQSAIMAAPHPIAAKPAFFQGQRVSAFWSLDGKWYPATVISPGPRPDGNYDIQWDDGDQLERVKPPSQLLPSDLPSSGISTQAILVPVAPPQPQPQAPPQPSKDQIQQLLKQKEQQLQQQEQQLQQQQLQLQQQQQQLLEQEQQLKKQQPQQPQQQPPQPQLPPHHQTAQPQPSQPQQPQVAQAPQAQTAQVQRKAVVQEVKTYTPKFEVGQDVDAKRNGVFVPAHIVQAATGPGASYTVAWDDLKKGTTAPNSALLEADIRAPIFQDRVKARWNHDKNWYDAKIEEKLPDGRYRITWFPPQPDDREKTVNDLKRIFVIPPAQSGCGCSIS